MALPPVNTQEGHAYLYANVGVSISNTKEGHGYQYENVGVSIANAREGHGYQYVNAGVNTPNAREGYGWQYLGDVDTSSPTPHVWYLRPDYGREGWEFKVVGNGFGDTQPTYSGEVLLSALLCGVIDWRKVAAGTDAYGPNRTIDPPADSANVERQEVRVTVPPGAASGLVKVRTNAP